MCPAGQRPETSAAVVLELDPGLAFGTGTHPTTALCLEWLDGAIHGGEHVLDFGCGSGILALAALKLGASRATAFDIDRQALHATCANGEKNGLAGRIAVPASAGEIAGRFDVVLTNILSGPLIALAPDLAARAEPSGRLVLAGLLAPQAGEVAQANRPWFDIGPASEREGWILLYRRPASRGVGVYTQCPGCTTVRSWGRPLRERMVRYHWQADSASRYSSQPK